MSENLYGCWLIWWGFALLDTWTLLIFLDGFFFFFGLMFWRKCIVFFIYYYFFCNSMLCSFQSLRENLWENFRVGFGSNEGFDPFDWDFDDVFIWVRSLNLQMALIRFHCFEVVTSFPPSVLVWPNRIFINTQNDLCLVSEEEHDSVDLGFIGWTIFLFLSMGCRHCAFATS